MANDEEYTYALPRIVTTQIQCAFGTYFWEMYTMEFGWTAAEYGKVQSLFNFTQCIFFIMFGIIFNIKYSQGTDNEDKQLTTVMIVELVAQGIHTVSFFFLILLPIRWHGITFLKTTVTKRNVSNTIASAFPSTLLDHAPKPGPQCAGCFNTPRMNAMKRFMGTRAFTVYSLVVVHGIGMCAFELCNKAIPVIIYPKKLILKIVIKLEIPINATGTEVKIMKASGSENLTTGDVFTLNASNGHPNARVETSGITPNNNNGGSLNNVDNDYHGAEKGSVAIAGQTNEVKLVVNNAATATDDIIIEVTKKSDGTASAEVRASNEAASSGAPNRISKKLVSSSTTLNSTTPEKVTTERSPGKDNSDLNTAQQAFDWNNDKRGGVITMNVLIFCGANLIVIWFFSFVRYYWRNDARLAKTFLTVSIIFMGGQVPILFFFHSGITPAGKLRPHKAADDTVTDLPITNLKIEGGTNISSLTTAASGTTITNNQVTQITITAEGEQEVDANRLHRDNPGDPTKDKIFNVLDLVIIVLVLSLTIFHSTVFFWIFTGGPLTFYVSTKILCGHEFMKAWGVPFILIGFAGATIIFSIFSNFYEKITGKTQVANEIKGWIFGARFKKSTFFVCIATQFFTLLFFNPCDYSWNESKWLNFMILIATGATNTMFVTYIYIVLDDVLKTYRFNWICYGLFFCVTNLVISKAMGIMFGAFGGQDVTGFKVSSVQVVVKHCFPCVYKSITITFWAINAMALLPIFANPLS